MKHLFFVIIFFASSLLFAQKIDSTAFPIGYPDTTQPVIAQLQRYPLPRYFPENKLLHLVNWMNPEYMGGRGHKGAHKTATVNSIIIQKELITNWHYGIVVSNSGVIFNEPKENGCPITLKLANEYPDVPLHVITFWLQSSPKKAGFQYKKPAILNTGFDSSLYVNFKFNGKPRRDINFNFPDSLIKIDGNTQKHYLQKIINCLTRPINLINENGEEPPGPYLINAIKKDSVLIKLKDSLKISSWEEFMAMQKLRMRNTYSGSFMNELPELKNTKFNFYSVEGGPIDRFKWSIMKKSMTPINGIYYSTPDFYPRWPKNWKDWMGAWHGWKWIETGRKTEIKEGDYLFSPFIAAGWSKKQEEDIRPAQWLGLLKCLSVVGAEFYYVGYFSLSSPFTDPGKWAWQAAIPSYAQAITSRFEDVLRDGNVLFDAKNNPVITYKNTDKNVLVTVRKHNKKEKYIICGTYQPFSNSINEIPDTKTVTINFNNIELTFEIRRQGSVYVYEKTDDSKILFYQLDKWHENAHPDYWTRDFCFEAENTDNIISNNDIYTDYTTPNNFDNYTTYINFSKNNTFSYNYTERDSISKCQYLLIRYKGDGEINVEMHKNANTTKKTYKLKKTKEWQWQQLKLEKINGINQTTISFSLKNGNILVDKFKIGGENMPPDK